MKLISCRIENYGKFSRADFNFEEGLTQFCGENGWGKTTLASFIKAMFYGLVADTARSKFNERRKFYPFDGGKFGGNLTFEWGGDVYRIERFFGKRSETEDELKVYKNGTISDTFKNKILGEAVFGLDESSFTRTVFITSEQIEMCSTGGINAKLNNYIDATEDGIDCESALAALDKAAKTLKMRGGKGAIYEQEDKIRAIKLDIADTQKIEESLDGKYGETEELTRKITLLEAEGKQANEHNLCLQKWRQYDYMLSAVSNAQEQLSELSAKYPDGLPSRAELDLLSDCAKTQMQLDGQAQATVFDSLREDRLRQLDKVFIYGAPSIEDIAGANARINTLRDKRSEIGRASSPPTPRQLQLCQRFDGKLPDETQLSKQRENAATLRRLQDEMIASPPQAKKSAVPLICAFAGLVIGIALLIVGLISSPPLIWAGVAVAAVAAIAAVILLVNRAKSPQAERQQRQTRIAEIRNEIDGFLAHYGAADDDVIYGFKKFEDDLAEYESIRQERKNADALLASLRADEEQTERELTQFFGRYNLDGKDLEKLFTELKERTAEYERLKGEKQTCLTKAEQLEIQIEEVKKTADGILGKYGITRGKDLGAQLTSLEKDGEAIARLNGECEQLKVKAENFRRENNLSERPLPLRQDENEIAEQLKVLRGRLATVNREIADAEAYVSGLGEKKNALENEQEKLEEYKDKYLTYTSATEALKIAEQNLKDKYIFPVKEKFVKYSDALERALGERVNMDKDFRITFERGGENRTDGHLSAGQRAICALCFRLALIDNMFEGEKPFIIMDDPFVDLDEEHMRNTARLVRELAADKQIIYFCCHESRKIQ